MYYFINYAVSSCIFKENLVCHQNFHKHLGFLSPMSSNNLILTKHLFQAFALWSEWSKCSLTCGTGEKTRTRKCETNCDDVSTDQLAESKGCNDENCPGNE